MYISNGNITTNRLLEMVYSKEYEVWYEPHDEPSDWDWKKDGFYRSPNKRKITTKDSLLEAIKKEYNKEGNIIYDITREYYNKHPYIGEAKTYIKEVFDWQYASAHENRYCYRISECLDKKQGTPLELVCYNKGFNNPGFTIGYWVKEDDNYEFKSCLSRLFEFIYKEDIPVIWDAIKAADKYINKKFNNKSPE